MIICYIYRALCIYEKKISKRFTIKLCQKRLIRVCNNDQLWIYLKQGQGFN